MAHRPRLRRLTKRSRGAHPRLLRIEPLEDRRVLSITVDTLLDKVDASDGVTSLREAIATANASAGADTIDFAPLLTAGGLATIVLTQGELAVTDALSITGPGANLLTIDASGNDLTPTLKNGDGSRVFNIGDGNNGTPSAPQFFDATIQGLTITGADSRNRFGGGIFSSENLTLQDCVITGNSVTADTSVYYGSDGGGISSRYANLTITDCTISNNKSSGRAGGVSFDIASFFETSRLTISGSTIENNTTANKGGGMYWAGDGSITNSTFEGNTAPGGIGNGGGLYLDVFTYFTGGERLISGTTFENNSAHLSGGGIYAAFILNGTRVPSSSALKIVDSHITDNAAGANGGGIATQTTTSTSDSFNFEIDSTELRHNTAVGNGGGLDLVPTFGAINGTVDGSTFSDNSAASGGGLYASVPQFTLTNSSFHGDTASSQGGGIYLSNGFSVDNCNVTQNSATTGAGIYASAGSMQRTLSHMQITDNIGDGLQVNSSVTTTVNLSNSNISGNQKAGVLATLAASSSSLVITNSTINSNGASGIRVSNGVLSLTDSQVSNNTSTQSGGGIFAAAGLTLTGCTVSSNTALGSAQGGGIAASSLTNTIIDSQVIGNVASAGGGISAANLTLTHSVLSNNIAKFGIGGGALLSQLTATSSIIASNIANNSGGGVNVGSASFTACEVSDNSTLANSSGGGGIYAGGTVTVSQSTVSGNSTGGSSSPGGGIQALGMVTLTQSTVSGNHTAGASSSGGGIYNARGLQTTDSTITNNHAPGANSVGGGIRTAPNSYLVSLNRTIIAGNTAVKSPDLQFHGTATITYSIVGDNSGTTLVESQAPNSNGSRIRNSTGGGIINPLLGPLANNGGPTFLDGSRLLTQAPLPGSPAINATTNTGSPSTYDERGAPWHRFNGNQDIGAIESQPNPLPGDYNFNGVVDASDFLVWRLTKSSTTDLRADGDGNGVVDQADYDFWRAHFGQTLSSGSGTAEAVTNLSVVKEREIDGDTRVVKPNGASLSASQLALSSPTPVEGIQESPVHSPTQFPRVSTIDEALLAWLDSRVRTPGTTKSINGDHDLGASSVTSVEATVSSLTESLRVLISS